MIRKVIIEIITSLFIILWVYAGLSKLLDYEKFRFQLGRSPFIEHIAPIVAWLLPIGEIAIAGLLVFKATKMLGMYLSFFLMLLFTGYIYAMLHYSYFIPCSCGGILSKMSWDAHLAFNLVFTFLGFAGILLMAKQKLTLNEQVNALL